MSCGASSLDGLLIGVGFSADARIGLLLVVAMTLEMGFLGVSVASSLGEAGWAKGRSILTVAGLALLVALGAVIGGTLLSGLTGLPLAIMLSFGAAALLFVATGELLNGTHEVEQSPPDNHRLLRGLCGAPRHRGVGRIAVFARLFR